MLVVIVATLGYYYWTGIVHYGTHHAIHGPLDDHFNLLSHGFRKGQLSLDLPVPQALLDSPNPYDPALRPGVSVPHDASYYRGRYYIYFGPAPVLTLFLPFSVLTGHDLPDSLAVFVFSSCGYLALVALFWFLQRRYYPTASLASQLACLLVLGGGTMVIALLRRPNIWEVSGSSGFFFFSLTLLCLIRALHSPRSAAWSVAGGLALGLAVASRPTYLLCAPLFALPLFWRRRPGSISPPPSSPSAPAPLYGWRALFSAAAACGLIGCALLAYNYARFDDPLEFGQKYQLSTIVEGQARHFSATYLPYNLHVYFFSTLRWFGAFPFVHGIEPPAAPDGHAGQEFALGLLPNLPFVAFGLPLAAGLLVRRLRGPGDDTRWQLFAILAAAAFLTFAPLAFFFGACVRYLADFTPAFMLLACLGLLECESRLHRSGARAALRGIALLLALFTIVVPALALADSYQALTGTPPPHYAPLARLANAPVRWLDRQRWPDYRPWDLTLTFPSDRSPRREPLVLVTKAAASSAIFFVEYLSPSTVRFGYHGSIGNSDTVFSPPLSAPPGATAALRITLGESSGPLHHGTYSWLRLHYDGRFVWETPSVSVASFPGSVSVGVAPISARGGLRFSGKIHSATPADTTASAPSSVVVRPHGGARIRLTLTPSARNRFLPLATTGVTGTGDHFYVRLTAADELVFGYDHWGRPSRHSPPFPISIAQAHDLEFWLPALAPAGRPPHLLVTVDGQTAWHTAVEFYPPAPENIFFGYNPIGGTATERILDQGLVEATNLPVPPLLFQSPQK